MTCAGGEPSALIGSLRGGDEPTVSKTDDEGRAIISSGLGHHALVIDDDEAIYLLRAAVEREGSQAAFAKRYGVNRSEINTILNGKRRVSGPIAKALGLRKVLVAE